MPERIGERRAEGREVAFVGSENGEASHGGCCSMAISSNPGSCARARSRIAPGMSRFLVTEGQDASRVEVFDGGKPAPQPLAFRGGADAVARAMPASISAIVIGPSRDYR